MKRFTLTSLAVATLLQTVAVGAPAWAGGRPGTPNQERADIVGPDRVRISFHNTEYPSSFHTGGDQPSGLIFGIEGQTDPTLKGQHFNLDSQDRGSFTFSGLAPGAHCYRIWSRLNDYLSELPSAWACAVLPEPKPPGGGAPLKVGTVLPNYGHDILWLAGAPGQIDLVRVTDGFVKVIADGWGSECAPPWRSVAYQNGGWPGLGPAGYLGHKRTTSHPYWLCWANEPPAPLPAPRVDR